MAYIGNWRKAVSDRLQSPTGPLSRRVTVACCYLLTIVAGSLLIAMREIDGALSQMRQFGSVSGGALQFPLQWNGRQAALTVAELRSAWAEHRAQTGPARATAEPLVLVERLFWLDMAFIASYTLLLTGVLVMATRSRPMQTGPAAVLGAIRRRMLGLPLLCVVPLAVVDVVENVALRAAYLDGSRLAVALGPLPVGPLLSALKLLLAALALVPLLVAGVAAVFDSAQGRQATTASRVILIMVGVTVLLLLTGIGADQVDDVIRAWDWRYALCAALAAVVAALVVVGTITELTGTSSAQPYPDSGADPLPVLVTVGFALGAVGAVCWAVGMGWGLLVPAGMILVLALLSAPLSRFMPVLRSRAPDPEPSGTAPLAAHGVLLARVAGAGLLVVLIWILVRAVAFPLGVRLDAATWSWVAELAGATLLLAGVGIVILLRAAPPGRARRLWGPLALVAAVVSLATLVPAWAVSLPTGLGTVAVLMLGLAGSAGAYTALARVLRRQAGGRFRLVPAIRVLGLKRFPVIAFGLVWTILVATLDRGGFHDIRTLPAHQPGPPPTLEQSYRAWLDAGADSAPPGTARPLVLVAAQGGGIRAAVWTALVMECVFGPGPVAGSQGCAGGAGDRGPGTGPRPGGRQPLPVFLASGASGGSLGLAVWSARRVDLAGGGAAAAGTPPRVETALGADFVAPDLARLLFGDLFHLFLAHDLPDRAEVLESAWERPWPVGRVGLARGLREAYQLANGTPGHWRIPILALNGTQVEDGCRLVAGPVDFHVSVPGRSPGRAPEGDLDISSDTACGMEPGSGGPLADVLPRTTELVDYLCPDTDVPLSTAAHLSARFPFVSPTGRVVRGDCADSAGLLPSQSISYDIDGGLFDNSGAATAQAAWRALAPLAAADEAAGRPCVVPLFLQIDNSQPGEPKSRPDPPPFELLAPAAALFGGIGSRQAVARVAAATEFRQPRSPAGAPVRAGGQDIDSQWFRVALADQPGPEPPLGWTLAGSTVDDMRAQLSGAQNRSTIAELRRLLTEPLRCAPGPR